MEVKVIAQMDNSMDRTFESANRIYDIYGLAPTIPTCSGGGIQPKILEIYDKLYAALDEQNKCLRFDTFGCLTTDGSSPKHNNRVIEFYEVHKNKSLCNTNDPN